MESEKISQQDVEKRQQLPFRLGRSTDIDYYRDKYSAVFLIFSIILLVNSTFALWLNRHFVGREHLLRLIVMLAVCGLCLALSSHRLFSLGIALGYLGIQSVLAFLSSHNVLHLGAALMCGGTAAFLLKVANSKYKDFFNRSGYSLGELAIDMAFFIAFLFVVIRLT